MTKTLTYVFGHSLSEVFIERETETETERDTERERERERACV